MIKFSNLYKLISEGLYITNDNKYDYHPIDKPGDLIKNYPTSRLYSNLPDDQLCFVSYIIPETFSMTKIDDKNTRKDQRTSLYHTLKQYFSIDYAPDIPPSPQHDKNIINLSNTKESNIKAPIKLEYINRLFDASISNFLFRFKK